LKTQFAAGYTYTDSSQTQISQFFDPAFLTQGAGLGYQPTNVLKTRLGLALREIITSKFTTFADDPSTPDTEHISIRGGVQAGVDVNWVIDSTTLFTSKLDLFVAFTHLVLVIVHWDNTLTAKVSKWISVSASMNLINERAISTRTQIRESIGLSIGYSIF
jgi:hypothetical protein